MFHALLEALQETLFMVALSGLLAAFIGLPLGLLLFITQAGHFWPKRWLHKPLSFTLQASQSVPYVMIMLAVIPMVKPIWGQHAHLLTAIIPLTLAAIPAVARALCHALNQVSPSLVDTALAFGATRPQILFQVLLPEALVTLIKGLTETSIHLVGYSTIAGALTGGGLSGLAIQKGYYALEPYYIIVCLLLTILLTSLIKAAGHYVAFGHFKHLI